MPFYIYSLLCSQQQSYFPASFTYRDVSLVIQISLCAFVMPYLYSRSDVDVSWSGIQAVSQFLLREIFCEHTTWLHQNTNGK